jgi:hypothetical protein
MVEEVCEHKLSDSQIEEIAEKAAEKAMEKITAHIYQNVGKSVVERMFWIVGAVSIMLYFWLSSKGVKI